MHTYKIISRIDYEDLEVEATSYGIYSGWFVFYNTKGDTVLTIWEGAVLSCRMVK